MLPLAVGVIQYPSRLWHCVKDLSRRFAVGGPRQLQSWSACSALDYNVTGGSNAQRAF